MRDIQKARLYKAEQAVRREGRSLGSFEEAASLVAEVQASPWFTRVYGGSAPLSVGQHFGISTAWYQPGYDLIALPAKGEGDWAYNALVILHEIAHHLEVDRHGPRFAGAFLFLVRNSEGDEMADRLAESFTKHNVRVRTVKEHAA